MDNIKRKDKRKEALTKFLTLAGTGASCAAVAGGWTDAVRTTAEVSILASRASHLPSKSEEPNEMINQLMIKSRNERKINQSINE